MSEFDLYSEDYDAALERGLRVSGESKEYFARGRVEFLKKLLARLGYGSRFVVDFGCGVGTSVPYLRQVLGAERVLGLDVSPKSLEIARRDHGESAVTYKLVAEYIPEQTADLVFCSGVFHHIPPEQRAAAVRYVAECLRPGGLFALWDNNPWNPGARYVMSRIPFDRDAVMLSAREAARLARVFGGMSVLRVDHLFVFPRFFRLLRWLEPRLTKLPVGAQYQVLARKGGAQGSKATAASSAIAAAGGALDLPHRHRGAFLQERPHSESER